MLRVIAALLAVATLIFDPVMPRRSESAGGCTHVVKNSGAGASKFRVCVSAAGNIIEFETPAGDTLINPTFYEGYHLCSDSIIAYDHSVNFVVGFGAPTLTDSLPVTINRTTSDGVFTVTQIFQPDSTEKDLKVTMKVKNNSAVTQTEVGIGRGWDAGTGLTDLESGWVSQASPRSPAYSVTMFYHPGAAAALTLTALSTTPRNISLAEYNTYWQLVRGTGYMCQFNDHLSSLEKADFFAWASYHLGSIAPGATKTVIFNYRRL
jgi:hypothetical protein